MKSITLEIENLAVSEAPLYRRYSGQTQPQPAFVALTEFGIVHADFSGEIGTAVPMDVWHGRTLRWTVPADVRGSALAELLQSPDTRALIERVHAGHRVEWNGSNNVGRLAEDAIQAREALERLFEDIDKDQRVPVLDVDDWLFMSCELFDHWKDGDLSTAVAEVKDEAKTEGVVLVGDIEQSLVREAEQHFEKGDQRLRAGHVAALLAAGKITQAEANSFAGIESDGEIEVTADPSWGEASARLWWRSADRSDEERAEGEGWQGTPYQVGDAGMGNRAGALKLVGGWLEMQG